MASPSDVRKMRRLLDAQADIIASLSASVQVIDGRCTDGIEYAKKNGWVPNKKLLEIQGIARQALWNERRRNAEIMGKMKRRGSVRIDDYVGDISKMED